MQVDLPSLQVIQLVYRLWNNLLWMLNWEYKYPQQIIFYFVKYQMYLQLIEFLN